MEKPHTGLDECPRILLSCLEQGTPLETRHYILGVESPLPPRNRPRQRNVIRNWLLFLWTTTFRLLWFDWMLISRLNVEMLMLDFLVAFKIIINWFKEDQISNFINHPSPTYLGVGLIAEGLEYFGCLTNWLIIPLFQLLCGWQAYLPQECLWPVFLPFDLHLFDFLLPVAVERWQTTTIKVSSRSTVFAFCSFYFPCSKHILSWICG